VCHFQTHALQQVEWPGCNNWTQNKPTQVQLRILHIAVEKFARAVCVAADRIVIAQTHRCLGLLSWSGRICPWSFGATSRLTTIK
jgi:hypothetical protein